MADKETQHYESSIASIAELQSTCRTDETGFLKKLKSLEAVKQTPGTKVTEAVFEEDGFTGLGDFTIEKFTEARKAASAFQGTAFILSKSTKVLVFRPNDVDATPEPEL